MVTAHLQLTIRVIDVIKSIILPSHRSKETRKYPDLRSWNQRILRNKMTPTDESIIKIVSN